MVYQDNFLKLTKMNISINISTKYKYFKTFKYKTSIRNGTNSMLKAQLFITIKR